MIDFSQVTGFQWDDGNARKNLDSHDVSQHEAEQVFRDPRLLVIHDVDHSYDEARFNAFGFIPNGRLLHVTFTIRNFGTTIRVISVRDMDEYEESIYVQGA